MHEYTKNILLLVWAWGCLSICSAQEAEKTTLARYERRLCILFDSVVRGSTVHVRYDANEKFQHLLKEALQQDGAFRYPFDSLNCVKLQPTDNKFRMFNWAVQKLSRFEMEYFAVMMVYIPERKNYITVALTDVSEDMFDFQGTVGSATYWFGAYYSKAIVTKSDDKTYYTLLGWNGNDKAVNRKVIEVMTFKTNGQPVFGASVFRWNKEKLKRKVFEYSRKSDMLLTYDYQTYVEMIPAKKKGDKPKEKRTKANMIIFDRLLPSLQMLSHNPEHYVPSGRYDALLWNDGRWTIQYDILTENRKENPRKPRKG